MKDKELVKKVFALHRGRPDLRLGQCLFMVLSTNDVDGIDTMMKNGGYDPYYSVATPSQLTNWLADHIQTGTNGEVISIVEDTYNA